MRTSHPSSRCRRFFAGFTLLEISMVLALLLALIAVVGLSTQYIQNWKRAKDGSLALQAIYEAPRAFMADHPTSDIAIVTSAQLVPYLPQGWTVVPPGIGLDNETLTADFHQMPPKWTYGSGVYDPSASSTDGLWDVGE